ncbi:MAG: hypothetical protein ABIC36_03520 [bacterium]
MRLLNILGLITFFAGIFVLAGFGFYEFFKDSEIPFVVKLGITVLILGIIIILISLIKERLKEKKI